MVNILKCENQTLK